MKPVLLLTALLLTAIITYHIAYEKGYRNGGDHQKVVLTEREGIVRVKELRVIRDRREIDSAWRFLDFKNK